MSKVTAAAIIIGVVMPFVVAFIKQVKFPWWANLLVSLVLCSGTGVLTVYAAGQWSTANILGTVGLIFVSAQAAYATFWKSSGIETRINSWSSVGTSAPDTSATSAPPTT